MTSNAGSRRPKQVYFFLMPEETVAVLDYMRQQGAVVLDRRSNEAHPHELLSNADFGQVFITPADLLPAVQMYRVTEAAHALDESVSPVIEFDCSFLRPSALSRGRVVYRSGYMGREGWVPFDDSVKCLFASLVAFLKKNFFTKERRFTAIVSKGSLAYEQSGGQLTQF